MRKVRYPASTLTQVPFTRAVLGVDYAFANKLSRSGELYQGPSGPKTLPPSATRYVGAYLGYETPPLKWSQRLVFYLTDRSRAIDARLSWQARQDLELTLAVQTFDGPFESEYGRRPASLLVQLQRFF